MASQSAKSLAASLGLNLSSSGRLTSAASKHPSSNRGLMVACNVAACNVAGPLPKCKCSASFTATAAKGRTVAISGIPTDGKVKGDYSVHMGQGIYAVLMADCEFATCPVRANFYDAYIEACKHVAEIAKNQGGSCMLAGTMIKTTDGHRPVESIQEGDQVLGRHGNVHIVLAVVKTYLGNRCLVGVNDLSPFFTPEHLFRNHDGGLVCHDHEQLGRERFLLKEVAPISTLADATVLAFEGPLKVDRVHFAAAPPYTPVYDIILDDLDGTYYANSLACASTFPEVPVFYDFFLTLKDLATQMPKEELTAARVPDMVAAAMQLVTMHWSTLCKFLDSPSNLEMHAFPKEQEITGLLSTKIFYLYLASGLLQKTLRSPAPEADPFPKEALSSSHVQNV